MATVVHKPGPHNVAKQRQSMAKISDGPSKNVSIRHKRLGKRIKNVVREATKTQAKGAQKRTTDPRKGEQGVRKRWPPPTKP